MAVLLTGATGYLGSYLVAELLANDHERLSLLVRAESIEAGKRRLWQALQLHMDFAHFCDCLERIDLYLGDLTDTQLGLTSSQWDRLATSTESVIHVAAAVNRKSTRLCLDVNLRGTLAMLQLARAAHTHHGLRRFSVVSTVSAAGFRRNEVVREDENLRANRADNDPYGWTKQYSEYLLQDLFADIPHTIFRPSAILGDSRFPQTTQFDNARAFALLAKAYVLPVQPDWRIDLISADYVAQAIVALHQKDQPTHEIYHLSSGLNSPTYRELVSSLCQGPRFPGPLFLPALGAPVTALSTAVAALPRRWPITRMATLLKVYMPYLMSNTVFDNQRVTAELGLAPPPFRTYAQQLYRFIIAHRLSYPYKPWPETVSTKDINPKDHHHVSLSA